MGTWVGIEASAPATGTAHEAIRSAFAAVDEVDRLMHPSREGSDLRAIRVAAVGAPVAVQRATWEVLCLAKRVSQATQGVFDPCLPSAAGTLADIVLTQRGSAGAPIVVCNAPVAIDLGGIAKGYAVDRAVEALRAAGCSSGLVNAGGDLRGFGTNAHTIFLKRGATAWQMELLNSALAVSDVDAAERPSEHRGYYVGGSTQPELTCRYAAVLAGEAAIADALAKCVLLCPAEVSAQALAEFGASRVIR